MGRELCRHLQAKLYLACIWSPNQVTERNLVNMTSRELYPGERYLCPGYLPAVKRREYAGRPFMGDFLPHQGHTVVKVALMEYPIIVKKYLLSHFLIPSKSFIFFTKLIV